MLSQGLRVLFVITRANLGGAQTLVYELLRARGADIEASVVVGEDGPFVDMVRGLDVPIQVVPNLRRAPDPLRDLRGVGDLVKIIRHYRPNLAHLHCSKAGVLGRIACAITRTPCIVNPHGWSFSEGVPTRDRIIGWMSEWVCGLLPGRITCVSEYDYKLAARYGVGRRSTTSVIRNGIPDVPHQTAYAPANPVNFVMVARFAPQKDPILLVRVLARMDSPATVTFVGDGELVPASKQVAEDLGISDRVTFLGDRLDVAEILASCDVFALTTNFEGLPVTIIEAMRAGLPVVSSDVGGVSEAVVHDETGLLVPRGDLDAVVAAANRLAADASLRERMGRAGRRRYIDYFTESAMIEPTFRLYEEVAKPM